MNKYRVLVVDDDEDIIKAADGLRRRDPRIEVIAVVSLEAALVALQHNFFNAAFVDVVLNPRENRNADGIEVLRHLQQLRPSCTRHLMTSHLKRPDQYHLDMIASAFRPSSRLAERMLQKEDFGNPFATVIEKTSHSWLDHCITVENAEEIAKLLNDTLLDIPCVEGTKDKLDITADEVDFIVSSIFTQGNVLFNQQRHGHPGEVRSSDPNEDICRVSLRPISGGHSPSVVVEALPYTASGRQGVCSIMKFAARIDAREEYVRFHRFVRFRISPHRRIELLGFCDGDVVSGLCWSYAGGMAGERLTSLQSLVESKDEKALSVLEDLAGPNAKDWYMETMGESSLAEYWTRAFSWKDIRSTQTEIKDFAVRFVEQFGGKWKGESLCLESRKFINPASLLGQGIFQRGFPACIVHGDLHGGNVLLGHSGAVTLIDFRSVGVGPRTVDFATLESSCRIDQLTPTENPTLQDILDYFSAEEEVLRSVWRTSRSSDQQELSKYWQRLSQRVGMLAKENFDTLTQEEYLAACLFWGCRVFAIPHLRSRRWRLFIWLCVVATSLSKQISR